jgi:hypothetical protein
VVLLASLLGHGDGVEWVAGVPSSVVLRQWWILDHVSESLFVDSELLVVP